MFWFVHCEVLQIKIRVKVSSCSMRKLSRTWLLYQLGLSNPLTPTNWIQLEKQPTWCCGGLQQISNLRNRFWSVVAWKPDFNQPDQSLPSRWWRSHNSIFVSCSIYWCNHKYFWIHKLFYYVFVASECPLKTSRTPF